MENISLYVCTYNVERTIEEVIIGIGAEVMATFIFITIIYLSVFYVHLIDILTDQR